MYTGTRTCAHGYAHSRVALTRTHAHATRAYTCRHRTHEHLSAHRTHAHMHMARPTAVGGGGGISLQYLLLAFISEQKYNHKDCIKPRYHNNIDLVNL